MIQIQLSTLINRYQLLSNMSQIYPRSVPGVVSGQFLDRNILKSPMALFLLVTASFSAPNFSARGWRGAGAHVQLD